MIFRLFGVKPLSEPLLAYINWSLKNELLWLDGNGMNLYDLVFDVFSTSLLEMVYKKRLMSWSMWTLETLT